MKRFRTFAAAVTLAAAAVLVAGCGPSTATATGEVTYDGTPIDDGHITFTPADGKGADAGGPIRGGRYEVAGMTPGPKVARVVAVKKVNFASTSEEMMKKAAEARKAGKHDGLIEPADVVPADAAGNNAPVDLKAGANPLDFHLKKPAKKA